MARCAPVTDLPDDELRPPDPADESNPPPATPGTADASAALDASDPSTDSSTDASTDADAARGTDIGWRAFAGTLDDTGIGWPPPSVAADADAKTGTEPSARVADITSDSTSDLDPDAGGLAVEYGPAAPSHPGPRRWPRWLLIAFFVQLGVLAVFVVGVMLQFTDKVIISPGKTFDTEQFVHVDDHPRYRSDASISLVSVRTSFAPSLFELIGGWLDGALEVVDIDDILGERTPAQNREDGRLQMDQSTEVAIAVALEHLGHEIMTPVGARVERIMAGTPAAEALLIGDIVQSVDDTQIMTAAQLAEAIRSNEPGTVAVLSAIDPDGESRPVSVTLADRDGVALLGVVVTTHVQFADLPIDVALDVENIGGPSAGLAFTLSVIDALTPEPLTGDLNVAATGTIHHDGSVGPIGGVSQKAHAVVRSGFDLFLVPAGQVEEAAALLGPAVSVVGVDSLEEAIAAIEAHQP